MVQADFVVTVHGLLVAVVLFWPVNAYGLSEASVDGIPNQTIFRLLIAQGREAGRAVNEERLYAVTHHSRHIH